MDKADPLLEFSLRVPRADITELVRQDFTRLQKERQDLHQEQEEYEAMRKAVGEVHVRDPILLDIGGEKFKTSRATLQRDQGSMLAAMFKGSGFDMTPGEDGSFFIDRDGKHFRHILNYLRGCFMKEGLSTATINELAAEADFYQLADLYQLLRPPLIPLPPTEVGNGLVHFLGTVPDSSKWICPTRTGHISVSGTFGALAEMIGRSANTSTGSCTSAAGKHIIVQLTDRKLRPTHYSLAWNGSCHYGGTWALHGRQSAATPDAWVTLADSVSGLQVSSTNPSLFPILTSGDQFYQAFKLTCTGPDMQASCHCFHVGQFELYGDLGRQDRSP